MDVIREYSSIRMSKMNDRDMSHRILDQEDTEGSETTSQVRELKITVQPRSCEHFIFFILFLY